jgi:hypothetical protein
MGWKSLEIDIHLGEFLPPEIELGEIAPERDTCEQPS